MGIHPSAGTTKCAQTHHELRRSQHRGERAVRMIVGQGHQSREASAGVLWTDVGPWLLTGQWQDNMTGLVGQIYWFNHAQDVLKSFLSLLPSSNSGNHLNMSLLHHVRGSPGKHQQHGDFHWFPFLSVKSIIPMIVSTPQTDWNSKILLLFKLLANYFNCSMLYTCLCFLFVLFWGLLCCYLVGGFNHSEKY